MQIGTKRTLFPFETEIEVIFRDLDALGHVNNAVFLTYLEVARVKYLNRLFEGWDWSLHTFLLARAECDYHSPARMGERLVVGVGVSRFGRTSFDFSYRIESADGRLVATARTVQVMVDPVSQAPVPVPESFRAEVAALQQGWVSAD
jgi:acyl-CoA thioester hydrolase